LLGAAVASTVVLAAGAILSIAAERPVSDQALRKPNSVIACPSEGHLEARQDGKG
jgi:hypothetical protein